MANQGEQKPTAVAPTRPEPISDAAYLAHLEARARLRPLTSQDLFRGNSHDPVNGFAQSLPGLDLGPPKSSGRW
jgi:hypothetical protein